VGQECREKTALVLAATASDKFYPDFIVKMQNGLTLVVEYKGSHIADCRDSDEKKRIGQLWANEAADNIVLCGWKRTMALDCRGSNCQLNEGD